MKGSVKLPVFIDDARKLVNTTQLRAKYLGASYEAEYCQWQTLHGLGSLMETASLIITPNAYLEGKLLASYPPDPIGDFDVTRATTATRVNSQGLVELVPYNLFTYSEQFDNADWSKSSGTITANATTAPNGTTTADLYTANGALSNHDFFEGFTGGSQTTASIYVKKNTAQYVYISLNYQSSGVNWATGIYDLDALTTATFQSGGVTSQVATISDEGNGWRRITLKVDTANTDLYCMYGLADSMSPTLGSRGRVENSSSASFYAWGAQLVEGSVAKDYQKTETRLNIPRLDYSNGTCPSILVEPQRTNILKYSEDLTNAAWSLIGTITRTANYGTAPDGTQTSTRIQWGGGANFELYQYSGSASPIFGSLYVKGVSGQTINFNGSTKTFNGDWQRIEELLIIDGSNTYMSIRGIVGSTTALDFELWGAQGEAGSYATSYIPTTSASVTRNADVISKTGISSLIGQTEGTLFWDVDFQVVANNDAIFIKENASFDTFVFMQKESSGIIACGYYGSGALQARIESSAVPTGRYKIAFAYKNNDFVMYLNGTQVGTDTSGTVSGLMDYFDLHWTESGCNNINASALWKTRLTNTQLASLTTL